MRWSRDRRARSWRSWAARTTLRRDRADIDDVLAVLGPLLPDVDVALSSVTPRTRPSSRRRCGGCDVIVTGDRDLLDDEHLVAWLAVGIRVTTRPWLRRRQAVIGPGPLAAARARRPPLTRILPPCPSSPRPSSRPTSRPCSDRPPTFREGQREAIEAVVRDGSRTLVVQRTGWGKSLVYWIATRVRRDQGHGPTLIVSPLLSSCGTRSRRRTGWASAP